MSGRSVALFRVRCNCTRALAFLQSSKLYPFRVIAGLVNVGIGEIELEWNRLEQAEYHLRVGLQMGDAWRHITSQLLGYFLLARARMLLGDLPGANAAHQQLEEAIYDSPHRLPQPYLRGLVAQFEFLNGNQRAGERWVRTNGLSFRQPPEPLRAAEYFVMAQVLLSQRKPEGIVEFFTPVIPPARASGHTRFTVEMLALTAIAYHMQGKVEEATTTMLEALKLAEPEDYRRLFLDKGDPVQQLLLRLRTNSAYTSYIAALLDDFERKRPLPPLGRNPLLPSMLSEPLSDREVEVLRLIATGHSNEAIGGYLFIGVGTVKTHVKNILRKLNAKNRTEAAARARKLGFIKE